MYLIKLIFFTIVELLRQARLLPRGLIIALRRRRERDDIKLSENERLDRIRNPSKYAGR